MAKKQQQTKTTKHTIEFSNNTPARAAQLAPRQKPRTRRADDQEPTEVGHFPLGAAALFGPGPCRSDESTSYVRENSESNGLIGRVFRVTAYRAHSGASTPTVGQRTTQTICSRPRATLNARHARRPRYSACRDAAPTNGRGENPTAAAPTPCCRFAGC